jgi:Domain of unknown function (DUF4272)
MDTPEIIDPVAVKKRSEATVLKAGGKICDWLPVIEMTKARDLGAVVDRALVLNALLHLYFRAPSPIIAKWIDRESLRGALSVKESELLAKPTESLTEQEHIDLYWYIEGLWATLWATGLIDDMPFDRGVEDFMVTLCPNLQRNEDGTKFRRRMELRPYPELYAMRDLSYRFHWWARDAQLKGEATGAVRLDVVMERRKVLEWILDCEADWDDMPLCT